MPALSRLKNARREPTRKQLPALMDVTGLDLYDLLRIDRPVPGARPLPSAARATVEALGKPLGDTMPAPEAGPEPVREPPPELARLRPSPDQVRLAVRYGLNPRAAWRAFLCAPATRLDALDGQWRAWCEECGTPPGPVVVPAPEPYARPGELYAHLKPVERADFRPADVAPGPGKPGVRIVPP